MKKIVIAVASLLLSATMYAQELPQATIKNAKTGKKVPFNETIEKGKVTVISFWATWCVPCKAEIKSISLKLPEWQKEADFNYMTISIDEARAEADMRTYVLSEGWSFPYYIDLNADLKRALNFQTVPYTIIIGKDGKQAFAHAGYTKGGENKLWEEVKELVAAK